MKRALLLLALTGCGWKILDPGDPKNWNTDPGVEQSPCPTGEIYYGCSARHCGTGAVRTIKVCARDRVAQGGPSIGDDALAEAAPHLQPGETLTSCVPIGARVAPPPKAPQTVGGDGCGGSAPTCGEPGDGCGLASEAPCCSGLCSLSACE